MPQVTIPEKNNINRQAGSLVLTIEDASTNAANLLKSGPFLLKKEAQAFTLQTSSTNTQKQLKVNSNTTGVTTLIWTWIKNNHRLIVLNNGAAVQGLKENSSLNEEFGLMNLANPILSIEGSTIQKKTPTPAVPSRLENLTTNFELVSSNKTLPTPITYSVPVVINEPLRSVGEIKDRLFRDTDGLWKIERNVGEKVFTGSEVVYKDNPATDNYNFYVESSTIGTTISSTTKFQTSHLIEGIGEPGATTPNYTNGYEFGVFVFNFGSTLTDNSETGLKSWLTEQQTKGTPFTVLYSLPQKKIEPVAETTQKNLNLLEDNMAGSVLYGVKSSLKVVFNNPYFSGSFKNLTTYSQDVLYDAATNELLTKLKNSGTVLFDADYTQPMHYAKKPYLEATMAPRDNSPILVNDETGPMQRQYFFDVTTGLYGETNTESFVYRGENELFVSYETLDPTYKTTVRVGEESLGEPVTVNGNQIQLTMTPEQKEYWYGKTMDVTYRLARSYTVEYNEDAAHDSYMVRLENHQDQAVTITQEGNRFSNQRLMKEIEMNPIVNPQHTGFMYISKEEQTSQAFRLALSSNYIIANGLDSADFIVEVIDQDGNEVLSPYIDVFIMNELGLVTSQFGSFMPIINKDTLKAKNAAGRSYFKYQAPLIRKTDTKKTQKVFAVAYDRKHKIGAQVPLILRPSEPVYDSTGKNYLEIKLPVQTRSDAAIVFEYFARYYEKAIPAGHPILLLDNDQDGVLTYSDLNQFLIEQTNAVRMQEIAYALRETEAF